MSWIAALDTRAARLPRPLWFAYASLKWLLIVLGGYVVIGLYLQRMNPQYWKDMLG